MSSRANASTIMGACACAFAIAGCLVTIDRGRIGDGADAATPGGDAMVPDAAAFELVWPVGGWVASDERHPNGADHSGSADIAVPYWTPVVAARSGTVVTSSSDDENGFFVTLDHGEGFRTLYAHLSAAALLEPGETVATGQQIGFSGRTGRSVDDGIDNGAHLHFAIVKDGSRLAIPSLELGSWVTRGAPIPGSYAPLPPLPAERTPDAFEVKVVAASAPLYDAAATTASVIGSVTSGDVLRVVDSRDGYYGIELDGGRAWIVHSATATTGAELSLAVVTTAANVRSGPSTADAIISGVQTGTLVTILGRSGPWGRLLVGQPAVYGWIHLDNTSPTPRFQTHVRSKSVEVRSAPGVQHPVRATRAILDPLLVEDTREGWYRIDLGGEAGWLPGWTTQGPL